MRLFLSFALVLLMLMSFAPVIAAEEDPAGIESLAINPYGCAEASVDTVRWFISGGKVFLFLPAVVDLTVAKVYYTASGAVTLDGVPITSGDPAAAFSVGEHTLSCGGQTYALTVMQSAWLPSIFIETESGSLDYLLQNKENKEAAVVRVYEDGALTLDSELKSIKGRGNSTWFECPKKPFNIKFDKKISLLGMPKAKKWSLLANYKDNTDIKTPAGLALGRMLGIPYTSECRCADLYLNGEYYGNFTVCESVEVGDNRVEITDLEKLNETANPDVDIESLSRGGTGPNGTVQDHTVKGSMKWVNVPNDPADISGGYLLELDFASRYDEEISGFVSDRGQWVVIKSPEYASEAQVRYIAGLYNEAEEAIYSETGYNGIGNYYTEYFDMETLAKTYLFMELQKPLDSSTSSFYFYKDTDADLFVAAPVWDFDRGFYTPEAHCGCDLADPDGWCSNAFSYLYKLGDPFDTETFLSLLFRHEDFRLAAAETWSDTVFGTAPERIDALFGELYAENTASRQMDLVRWLYADAASPISSASAAADAYFGTVSAFVHNRLGILNNAFGGDLAMLYYNANGGAGHVFNREIAFVGGSVRALSYQIPGAFITPPAGKSFCGWNTKADGTGTTYQPGERIPLTTKTTTLYALWDAPDNPSTNPDTEPSTNPSGNSGSRTSLWQRIKDFFNKIAEFFRRLFR